MFSDLAAQDLLLLAGLYLTTGLVMVAVVALVPHGKKPKPSMVITWPFVIAAGLLGLIRYLMHRLTESD